MVGGLIILKPDMGPLLQYAATASFLSKLYSDYLDHLKMTSASCKNDEFSVKMLRDFSSSQANPLPYGPSYCDLYKLKIVLILLPSVLCASG